MSVITYLNSRASSAVLSTTEKASVERSIATLTARLDTHFSTLKTHFQFGSSTRGTILPRLMDRQSDIDYMVVFKDEGITPQAYLDRLKKFAEKYYSQSEIYQSSPTIVLELNHIRFELVPAVEGFLFGYKIPDGLGSWQSTNPNDFNATLTDKNSSNGNLIKPTIRLAKFWNATSGYVFDSFGFEKWIVDLSFMWSSNNQRDFLFNVFHNLPTQNIETQWRKDRIERAKAIVTSVRKLEKDRPDAAEIEVRKLIPM
jgi:hypothetical protein